MMGFDLRDGAILGLALLCGVMVFRLDSAEEEFNAYKEGVVSNAHAATLARLEAEQHWGETLLRSESDAREREQILQDAVVHAADTASQLRGTITALRGRITKAPTETCPAFARVLADVFAECSDAYRKMGQDAARADGEARRLWDGWPTSGGE